MIVFYTLYRSATSHHALVSLIRGNTLISSELSQMMTIRYFILTHFQNHNVTSPNELKPLPVYIR